MHIFLKNVVLFAYVNIAFSSLGEILSFKEARILNLFHDDLNLKFNMNPPKNHLFEVNPHSK